MDIKKTGKRTFLIKETRLGHTWEFELKSPLFMEGRVGRVAEKIVSSSAIILETMWMARTLTENSPPSLSKVDSKKMFDTLKEASMLSPSGFAGFRSKSGGIDQFHFERIRDICENVQKVLISNAPVHGIRSERDLFSQISQKMRYTTPLMSVSDGSGTNVAQHMRMTSREKNVPFIVSRSRNSDSLIQMSAMRKLTAHIPDNLPGPDLAKDPQKLSREEVLWKTISPDLISSLNKIQDPEQKRIATERMERLEKRLMRRSRARGEFEDLMMTLETFEETLNERDAAPRPDM